MIRNILTKKGSVRQFVYAMELYASYFGSEWQIFVLRQMSPFKNDFFVISHHTSFGYKNSNIYDGKRVKFLKLNCMQHAMPSDITERFWTLRQIGLCAYKLGKCQINSDWSIR